MESKNHEKNQYVFKFKWKIRWSIRSMIHIIIINTIVIQMNSIYIINYKLTMSYRGKPNVISVIYKWNYFYSKLLLIEGRIKVLN